MTSFNRTVPVKRHDSQIGELSSRMEISYVFSKMEYLGHVSLVDFPSRDVSVIVKKIMSRMEEMMSSQENKDTIQRI
jgi:hypothetical protein